MQQALSVGLAILATFGISSLLTEYSGFYNIFHKLRYKARGELKSMLECMICTAVWLAIPVSIVLGVGFMGYLAVIGGVILLERIT